MDRLTLLALPKTDQVRLKNSAKIAQALEDLWASRIGEALAGATSGVLAALESGVQPELGLEKLFIEHFFQVSITAAKYAESEAEMDLTPPKKGQVRAARRPAKSRTLKDLMRLYDLWRQGKYRPKEPIAKAKAVQTEYLKKVQSVWERYSRPFRKGDIATQEIVVEQVKKAASTTVSRAKTIVRTETTNYYNQARTDFYDESQDITHYLFVAIRDAATSPWCTPQTVKGKRGRSGLVYAKDDPLRKKEQPACHPNCRSEFLPLNRLNPAHLRFIQNLSIQRREHECYPLLKGWER